MKVAIIGGGAAGFFLAIQLKTIRPDAEVTILERQRRVLAKVEISGGGRCNCTNSFRDVTDLGQVYPRGARLLKRLFRQFNHQDMMDWLEGHGVPLVVQEDQCVFPEAQDSHAIINCFLRECKRLNVEIKTGVDGFEEALYSAGDKADRTVVTSRYDCVVITTGGLKGASLPTWLSERLIIEPPLPSLFTFKINDPQLCALMGTVVEGAIATIPGTKWRTEGPLLITHWGMSGPAILKLSSHAARYLAERNYQSPLAINWTGESNTETVRQTLQGIIVQNPQRQVLSLRPFDLQRRLWEYLIAKLNLRPEARWSELGKKNLNRLIELLTNDQYQIAARATNKDEFVTCGGVSLKCVDSNTLELITTQQHSTSSSPTEGIVNPTEGIVNPTEDTLNPTKDTLNPTKGTLNPTKGTPTLPHIFFAGEVLDIDGVTGGFNFQAAWSTAFAVAQGIAKID